VIIRKGSWDEPPIFTLIREKGGVPEAELYQVFNMGIGMVIIAKKSEAQRVLKFVQARKHKSWIIGEVVRGKGIAGVE
jgi:phosphoribosylformylglycinamidine cyclo-ligase